VPRARRPFSHPLPERASRVPMGRVLSLVLAAMIWDRVTVPVELLSSWAGKGALVVWDVKCVIGDCRAECRMWNVEGVIEELVTVSRERRPASAPLATFVLLRLAGMARPRPGA
jgi:hypothetical protein